MTVYMDKEIKQANIASMQQMDPADMEDEVIEVIESLIKNKGHGGSTRGLKINGKLYFLTINKKNNGLFENPTITIEFEELK